MTPFLRLAIRLRSLSTTTTEWPRSAKQAPVTRPTCPAPTTLMSIPSSTSVAAHQNPCEEEWLRRTVHYREAAPPLQADRLLGQRREGAALGAELGLVVGGL